MRARWGGWRAGVGLAVLAVIGAIPPSVAAKTVAYAGQVAGDPETSVAFNLRVRHREPQKVRFQFTNVLAYGDDGSTCRQSYPRFTILMSGQVFHDQRAFPQYFLVSYLEVRGKLAAGGVAHGFLSYTADRYDDTSGLPDLTTGRVQWTAQRVIGPPPPPDPNLQCQARVQP